MYTGELLIDDNFLLKKFPGKGGWTYTVLPSTIRKRKTPFGWIQVSGFIDNFELKKHRLMPMKSGELFLPVRAEVRKKIAKQEGDTVQVVLYADNANIDVPGDFLICLKENDKAYNNYLKCSKDEQDSYINFIASAINEEVQITRMAQCLDMLENGVKFLK